MGWADNVSERLMWGRMNMAPTDIPRRDWFDLHLSAEWKRRACELDRAVQAPENGCGLRFINGSSMTFFDVRIPGLPMTVVQSDGNDVEPVTVDEFRIGIAETYDVIVEPKDERRTRSLRRHRIAPAMRGRRWLRASA